MANHGATNVDGEVGRQAGREVVALAREMLGGNGIVSDFLVAKQFCDMEVGGPALGGPALQ